MLQAMLMGPQVRKNRNMAEHALLKAATEHSTDPSFDMNPNFPFDEKFKACARCGERLAHLHVCSGCMKTRYCSRECQKAHWKAGHRDTCKPSRKHQSRNK
eukprot:TRINITY_DN63827_c0_g1_i1.p3 TRINITY_DN63827_c0_g1~~TRINITY_DN63827_c0_g1_i1.p3  ORF type:complete len:101 (-),score=10.48 TRINITY_DN63827_c0_g1_i1:221-523(-)